MAPYDSPLAPLLRATASPRDGDRKSARARLAPLLATPPAGADQSAHLAAALGDATALQRILAADPAAATARGGPFQWDPLTHLAFSVLLDEPRDRTRDFVGAARVLLEAGADARTGFADPKAEPGQEFRSALYAAAAIARDVGLTQLLLAHGADPNDEEVAYHTPEHYDNATLQALVESGRCTPDTLATMLLRKSDWHDVRGIRWLLDHGADVSRPTRWRHSILQHAITRDNDLEIIQVMLDHGADPLLAADGLNAMALAARYGRGDVLDAIARRGVQLRIEGADALLAACARGHAPAVRTIADSMPAAVDAVHGMAGAVLARFASHGNSTGLRLLLELGLPVDARFREGFGYMDIAPLSTALHVAAWRGWPACVRTLLAAGADPMAKDARDRTPMMLAVRACVDSFWTDRRTSESVEALLKHGATAEGVTLPCGYDRVDALLSPS
jgi:ankyrin repeat protein